MLHRTLVSALAICAGAVLAVQAVGQSLPGTPQTPAAPDMTGWFRVGNLYDGQRIFVSLDAGFPIRCVFRGTTDHSLLCDQGIRLFGVHHREIARDEVKRVRTDDAAHKADIVVLTFAGAGALLGGVSQLTPNEGSLRVAAAGIGLAVGAGFGALVSAPIVLSNDDKTIYTQPRPPSAAHLHKPLRKRPAQPTQRTQTQ
jgi:hypothetical protein